jgi:hypothetical protein
MKITIELDTEYPFTGTRVFYDGVQQGLIDSLHLEISEKQTDFRVGRWDTSRKDGSLHFVETLEDGEMRVSAGVM